MLQVSDAVKELWITGHLQQPPLGHKEVSNQTLRKTNAREGMLTASWCTQPPIWVVSVAPRVTAIWNLRISGLDGFWQFKLYKARLYGNKYDGQWSAWPRTEIWQSLTLELWIRSVFVGGKGLSDSDSMGQINAPVSRKCTHWPTKLSCSSVIKE